MPEQHPNVLIIVCHDLGRFLHCYGIDTIHSPNLDHLADDGIKFTRAFCTAPQCSSSRASLYTGRYPHSNGVMGLTHALFGWDLYPQEQHLGQILLSAGYTTALFGIHHESRRTNPADVAKRCGMEEIFPPAHGEQLSDRAIELLTRYAQQDRPFYLQLGYEEPHRLSAQERDEPDYEGFIGDYIEPDSEFGVTVPPYLRDTPMGGEELAELQGAIRYVDAQIGRVLSALRDLGLEENTLVIATTDHGIAVPRAKCTLYDPGIESALILRLPARNWRGGRTQTELMSNVDILPTILEVTNIPVSEAVQGRSLRPLLDGEDYEARDTIFSELTYHDYYDPQRCIRTGQHKLIVYFSSAPAFMDPTQSWRPRTDPVVPEKPALAYHPHMELFKLDADPWERHNLAEDPQFEDVRRQLLERLCEWMRTTGDPLLHGAVTSPAHRLAVEELMGQGARSKQPRE
jgi:N-sulfoglucosamine sulfohydrolase